jgi:hypothetical protein
MVIQALLILWCALLGGGVAAAGVGTDGVSTGTGIGQRIPRFTAPAVSVSGDTQRTEAFDSHTAARVTAYVIAGTRCPATAAYAERLTRLERTYGPQGVDFIYIYPNRDDSREAKLGFHKEKGYAGRLIDDQGATIARQLGVQRTSELLLVDKAGIIVYRGAVDDSRDEAGVQNRYLQTALDELLAGKPITTASSQVFA